MPKFSVTRASSAQSITTGVLTKAQFNNEEFDTNSNFDSATNYRFTPTVAGYYFVAWNLYISNAAYDAYEGWSALYKNGSVYKKGSLITHNATEHSTVYSSGASLVYMNGSTDYLEVYGVMNSGSGTTINIDSYFNGALLP
jgi:hypothetical protein